LVVLFGRVPGEWDPLARRVTCGTTINAASWPDENPLRIEEGSWRGKVSMKALSIRQPGAWLLIHAARRPDDVMADIENRYGVSIDRTALQFSGIIGRVELVDVVKRSDSKWFLGPFGFVFRNPVALPFVPIGGRQKLFDLPAFSSPAE
jgi:hypothetical protein